MTTTTPLAVVDAHTAATAWINAAMASSDDPKREMLYRTVALDFYACAGLQFVGCNGHILLRTWTPLNDKELIVADRPAFESRPVESYVVMDPERFGLGFMKTLLAATKDEAHKLETLTLSVLAEREAVQPALGDALLAKYISLQAMGQRLDLRLMESGYPDWRRLRLGVDDFERVDGMAVAPRYLAVLGRLKGVTRIELDRADESLYFMVRATGPGDLPVDGILAPMLRSKEKTETEEDDETAEHADEEQPEVPERTAAELEAWLGRCDQVTKRLLELPGWPDGKYEKHLAEHVQTWPMPGLTAVEAFLELNIKERADAPIPIYVHEAMKRPGEWLMSDDDVKKYGDMGPWVLEVDMSGKTRTPFFAWLEVEDGDDKADDARFRQPSAGRRRVAFLNREHEWSQPVRVVGEEPVGPITVGAEA